MIRMEHQITSSPASGLDDRGDDGTHDEHVNRVHCPSETDCQATRFFEPLVNNVGHSDAGGEGEANANQGASGDEHPDFGVEGHACAGSEQN